MYRYGIKRILDLILSVILLPLVLLLFIPVSIMIKLDDKGPVFYNAPRLGEDLKEFKMYKFRTMINNAPDIRNSDGTTFNSENDPRLTKIGRILRKTSIDELPQIINVLKGDMSFIGPRPSPLGNEHLYDTFFMEKFKVKPGITGYNQALVRNNATLDERIKNDVFYVNNISLILDIKIVIMTIKSVVKTENIYRN